MNKKIRVVFLLCFLTGYLQVIDAVPSHILTFFFNWHPSTKNTPTEYPEGIIVTYYGNKATSNKDGQVIFPLYQQLPSVKKGKKLIIYLMICPIANPQMLLHATVDRFTLPKNTPYDLYIIEKIYDQDTQSYLWITKKGHLKNDIIPLKTIIVHANPDDIVIHSGATLTDGSPHIVLPTFLVNNSINTTNHALQFIQNGQFFAPVNRHITTKANETSDTQMTTNG